MRHEEINVDVVEEIVNHEHLDNANKTVKDNKRFIEKSFEKDMKSIISNVVDNI